MKKILFTILTFFLIIIEVQATADKENLVNIYLFHRDTCSHCQEEIKFLTKLEKKYPNIKIYKYEVTEEKNKEVLEQVEKLYNIKLEAVPVTIIGSKIYTGYSSEKSNPKLITTINYYGTYGYEDKLAELLNIPKPQVAKDYPPDIDEYINKNSEYNLLFNITSSDLDLSTSASLLAVDSAFNLTSILFLVIIAILIILIKNEKQKIISIFLYLLTIITSWIALYIIANLNLITIIILILSAIAIFLSLIKHKKHIINYALIFLTSYLMIYTLGLINNNMLILKGIFNLNLASTYEIILNLIVYTFTYIVFDSAILFIIYKIINKIYSKIKERKNKPIKETNL